MIFLVIGIIYASDITLFKSGDTLSVSRINELVSKINDLEVVIGDSGSTPSGAVMSFDLESCPTGWSEYAPAYGRFIRGIDKSGENIDADGERVLGSTQEDEFKSHTHGNIPTAYYTNYFETTLKGYYIRNLSGTSSSAGGDETRPKNVALLYCRKD